MLTKKNIITLFLTVFFSLVIAFLIYKKIIYPTLTPMVKNGVVHLFADWSVVLRANFCFQNGLDVFIENPCDPWNRAHVYGEILLYLPFLKNLSKFYLFYFPIIMGFLFIFITISFFNYNRSIKNFTLVFFILSAPFITVIERANIDILIFLIIFLISKNKNLFLNHFLILLGVLAKFYPICFGVLFLFKKNIKKILFNVIILSLLVSIFIFLQSENLIKIFNNQVQFVGGSIYAFSIKSLINTINNFNMINNFNWIKYFFITIFLFFPFILIWYFFAKSQENKQYFSEIFMEDVYENRLYIISSVTIISCYLIFQNIFYREIFFLGLLPWILKNENKQNNIKDFYFYFILFKFFVSTILIYLALARDSLFSNFKPLMILLKHSIDFYLVTIVFFIFFLSFFNFLKKNLILK